MNEDRRKHTRLELKAYGFNHLCRLQHGSSSIEVYLIDISPGGARVRFHSATSVRPEVLSTVHFDTGLSMNGRTLNGLQSAVRWIAGQECGLMFTQELDVASTDLQVLLAP